MAFQLSAVMLGVEDVERAKRFYVEGIGATVDQEFQGFVRMKLGEGSSMLALYAWPAVAEDIGVAAEGTGFRGVSLHYLAESREDVDRAMRAAEAAGASVITAPGEVDWGYFGTFADLDGHLWKVATAS